jgi:xylulokinase
MKYILSTDLGTSAIKTALFDETGKLVAASNHEYPLITPSALVVELEVETYWNAFKDGVRDVMAESGVDPSAIAALGISAQGETLIVVDKAGKPLRNAIVWMDSRAQEEGEYLNDRFKDSDIYGITGQVSIVPTWPAAKILWLRKHEEKTFKNAWKYLLIEDYFIYRMTGQLAAEGALLCSTTYWDIKKKTYWKEMLGEIGISEDQLPAIKEPGDPVGPILPAIAKELGLSEKTVVCMGLLDQAAGAIGVGNVAPGVFSECTGSALAIVATVDHPIKDRKNRMPCHYHGIRNTYMAHTFTTGGMVMKWFRDKFCESELAVGALSGLDPYEVMGMEAAKAPLGSDGLVMLPHLQGAMAPENDPKAKGVFFGITLAHTRAHFIRSIMESIAFLLQRNIEVVEEMGIVVSEIRSLGGGSRSDLWNQIKADVTGKPVVLTESMEQACLGAAIVAGAGIGLFKNLQDASRSMVKIRKRFEPNPENHIRYAEYYKKYVRLYEALKPVF